MKNIRKGIWIVIAVAVVMVIIGLLMRRRSKEHRGGTVNLPVPSLGGPVYEAMDVYSQIDEQVRHLRKNGKDLVILASSGCPYCKRLLAENSAYKKYVTYVDRLKDWTPRERLVMKSWDGPMTIPITSVVTFNANPTDVIGEPYYDSYDDKVVIDRMDVIEGYYADHAKQLLEAIKQL